MSDEQTECPNCGREYERSEAVKLHGADSTNQKKVVEATRYRHDPDKTDDNRMACIPGLKEFQEGSLDSIELEEAGQA